MKTETILTEESVADVGPSLEPSVTQTPVGLKREVSGFVVLSILLPVGVIGAIGAVWLLTVQAAPGAGRARAAQAADHATASQPTH